MICEYEQSGACVGRSEEKAIRAGSVTEVFLSYASKDASVAEAACAAIEGTGVACWIAPRNVTLGASYAGEIIHAIDAAKAFVLILSKNAVSSSHVLREMERAASKRCPILALRIDRSPLPEDFEYFLNTCQWLDASPGDVQRALPQLVSAVQRAIDAPVTLRTLAPPVTTARFGRTQGRTVIAVASGVCLALAIFAANRLWPRNHANAAIAVPSVHVSNEVGPPMPPRIPEKSVAVLPFVDMSEKKDHEYFSDGLSEELIEHLAHAPDLKVIARTSSFQFKGKSEDARAIATALGVANLLEGSVRTSGNLVRVTVQLIRASDGSHLWSESYDRNVRDIFKVQDDIAAAVVRALKTRLIGSADLAGGKEPTMEAYSNLLKGNYLSLRGHKGDTDRAIEHYKAAIKIDPNYALAWAKLGRQYVMKSSNASSLNVSTEEMQARDALEKALSLDPNLPTAYRWLGRVEMNLHWNWSAAKANFERAIALDPNSPDGAYAQADLWIMTGFLTGNFDPAIKFDAEQSARDPLDTHLLWTLSWLLDDARRPKEALAKLELLQELDPAFEGLDLSKAAYLLDAGNWAAAEVLIDKEPDGPVKLAYLGTVYSMSNRMTDCDAALHTLESQYAAGNAYNIASLHFLQHEKDLGFTWLRRAYQERDPNMITLKVDSAFDSVRTDERYRALLRNMQMSDSI